MKDQLIFDSLTPRGGELTTANRSLKIKGRDNVTIVLSNSSTAKLDSVFVLKIGMSLLSTQALLVLKITNCYKIYRFEFYKRDKIIAKGSHKGQTSYLNWVRDEYALYAPHKLANQANELAKINIEMIKKVTKIGLIHWRLST